MHAYNAYISDIVNLSSSLSLCLSLSLSLSLSMFMPMSLSLSLSLSQSLSLSLSLSLPVCLSHRAVITRQAATMQRQGRHQLACRVRVQKCSIS